jgi:hypothetical protein
MDCAYGTHRRQEWFNSFGREQKMPFGRPKRRWELIAVAARSKAWICGHSIAGIVDSNPAGGMDVCLL